MGNEKGFRIESSKRTSSFSFILLLGTPMLIVFGLSQGSAITFLIYPYLLAGSTIIVLINIIQSLRNKNGTLVTLQLISLPIVLLIFFVMFHPRDLFFSNQKIPENIDFELPFDLNSESSIDSLMSLNNSNFDIQLANYGQPGMYKYFVWTSLNRQGMLYLKAYDAIYNIELERISDRTVEKVNKDGTPISHEFTLYDGVWGNYYLARFEVWFKPKDGSLEQKIGEKTFKVEGWIR